MIQGKKYLFFADMLVGLIFKPLLNSSKRDVSIIFGNILTETEERAGGWVTKFDPLFFAASL